MKEKKTVPEKTIVIDIKLTRGLVVALSCVLVIVGLLAYLTLTGERAVASEAETAQTQSTGMRQFYMTKPGFFGDGALTACAPGYHMASLWEIVDPSNLKYNTALGKAFPDGGQGPPVSEEGWVRTGGASSDSAILGHTNCNAWTTASPAVMGTVARLPYEWTAGNQDMGVWDIDSAGCASPREVWCIED